MSDDPGYVLVVDDVPDILELLDATLKFKGYRVVTAHNGEEALEIIEKEHPALIIADILMPRMDGFSLVHRLRLNVATRRIPVVFVTATYVSPEDRAFALTIGVTRFLEKPVDLEQFLPMIEALLSQREPTLPWLNEKEFYEGYRKRLESKLKQKNAQIARDEHLMTSLSEAERPSFAASLHQLINEREEIQRLLDEIQVRLQELSNTE